MPNRTEARPAKAVLLNATGRLPATAPVLDSTHLPYAQPRFLSAMPAFHILVIWAILSPSNCIT